MITIYVRFVYAAQRCVQNETKNFISCKKQIEIKILRANCNWLQLSGVYWDLSVEFYRNVFDSAKLLVGTTTRAMQLILVDFEERER